MAELTYAKIIKDFVTWAKKQDNIRSAFIIGSRARTDHPADEWADLDIVIFADNPGSFVNPGSWVHEFGTVILTFVEPTPDDRMLERRVMYEGGLDVDFAFFPLEVISQILDGTLFLDIYNAFGRGVKTLFDKDEMLKQFVETGIKKPYYKPPSKEEFLNCVHDFLFHVVWTAKHLRRGEVFWAKSGCDSHLKNLLVKMLAWHARVRHGKRYDTWLRGRFLEEWADPRAIKEMAEAYGHYNEPDIWRALVNSMDLFRWVAKETARDLKYSYPNQADQYATAMLLQLQLEEDDEKSADSKS